MIMYFILTMYRTQTDRTIPFLSFHSGALLCFVFVLTNKITLSNLRKHITMEFSRCMVDLMQINEALPFTDTVSNSWTQCHHQHSSSFGPNGAVRGAPRSPKIVIKKVVKISSI